MKINVTVDLEEMFTENDTVNDWVERIIMADIKAQLKKAPEYKLYITQKTEEAIAGLVAKGE